MFTVLSHFRSCYNKAKIDQVILLVRNESELVIEASADADFMGEHEEALHPVPPVV